MAHYDLRIPDEEFWGLTMREVMWLFERHAAERRFIASCLGAEIKDNEQPSTEQSPEMLNAAFQGLAIKTGGM